MSSLTITLPDGHQMTRSLALIDAAPELLEALKNMVDIFDGYQGMEWKRAKAAIAKAEGK